MWSRWSHSAIYDEETAMVHDTTLWGGGCKTTPANEFFSKYTEYEFRDIDIAPERLPEARAWLIAQNGKKYDWTALLYFVFPFRDWQEDDAWFCSEECETFISTFSKPRFRESMSHITPKHQAMLV
jgi:uncharacterized protein YycO